MENNKLKIKIGDHEFEAEGPTEIVQAQFAAFKELVLSLPTQKHDTGGDSGKVSAKDPADVNDATKLEKIMKVDRRIISLTARCDDVTDEIMLVLLGQKMFRNNETVTGSEIIDGLKQTGHQIDRIDRILDKMTGTGNVITIGAHRARRYRLTNQGTARAQEIATNLISTVA